jgi:hypothetical protein
VGEGEGEGADWGLGGTEAHINMRAAIPIPDLKFFALRATGYDKVILDVNDESALLICQRSLFFLSFQLQDQRL